MRRLIWWLSFSTTALSREGYRKLEHCSFCIYVFDVSRDVFGGRPCLANAPVPSRVGESIPMTGICVLGFVGRFKICALTVCRG